MNLSNIRNYTFFYKRIKIFLLWLGSSIFFYATSTLFSILYWHFTYVAEPNVKWDPFDDAIGAIVMMPWGWEIAITHFPYNLISILALFVAILINNYKPIFLSILYAICTGWIWPKIFVAMMGI